MNTLKQKIKYILPLIVIIITASCIDDIDIDLNSTNPAVAVEGQIELDSLAWIRINYTTDYFSPSEPEYIDDATVTLTTESGASEILTYIDKGYYMGNNIFGEINEEYTISIVNSEINETAKTTLFAPTEIVEVKFEEMNEHFKDPNDTVEYYTSKITFTDDPDTHNYYLVKYWGEEEDEEKIKEGDDNITTDSVELVDLNYFYTLIDDKYYDEDNIEVSSWVSFMDSARVRIIVYSIDEDAYTFYYQMNDGNGGGGSTPYNPISNFGSEVMGYFLAWSYDTFDGYAVLDEETKE